MCGRYAVKQVREADEYFRSHPGLWTPSYNIAPTQNVAVVRQDGGGPVGLKMRWVDFRRRRIAEEFEKAIPAPPVEPTTSRGIATFTDHIAFPVPQQVATQNSLLRRIVSDAVQKMTDAELRALNLPLGYVLDALTTR